MTKPRVPRETRRLTRSEARRRGVSFSAKRRVRIGIKVTSKTKLYTDRQVAEVKLKKKLGKRVTKEFFTKTRVHFRSIKATGGVIVEYDNLTKPQLFKKLKKHSHNDVIIKFKARLDARKYVVSAEGIGWRSADARAGAREILEHWEMYLEDNEIEESEIFAYGLVVYP